MAANAAGELVGLGIVFAAGLIFYGLVGEPTTIGTVAALGATTVVLGVIEGSIVGWGPMVGAAPAV